MKCLLPATALALAFVLDPPLVSAQAPSTGLAGMQGGGQGGIFTLPRVDAHVRGIPGVTRPMLMAGPVGGGAMGGGGGQGFGMQVNPNWTGAAAMFMPQLLLNNGGGAGGGNANANSASGFRLGSAGPASQRSVAVAPANPTLRAEAPGPAVVPAIASQPSVRTLPPVDPGLVEERLLAYQQEQARQGSPSAQWALSQRYAEGRGVVQNPEMARVWLEAAARSGSEEAQASLGK